MANTFIKIASATVGSGGASSIDFTSIPSTYTDLVIYFSPRSTNVSAIYGATIQFNSSSSNFSYRALYGNGSVAGSYLDTASWLGEVPAASSTSNTFGNVSIYIPNYSGSTNKSFSIDNVGENNATAARADLIAELWSNTAAINSVKLQSAVNFAQYSTATLYGIKNS
jgi:hypothetical protein